MLNVKKISNPLSFLSLGVLSVMLVSAGCGSDTSGGSGGKGGTTAGAGGGTAAGGKGGSAAGGAAAGGAAGGSSGGAAGGSSGGAAGGAAGGSSGGAAGGQGGAATGGAAGSAAGGAGGTAAGGSSGAAGAGGQGMSLATLQADCATAPYGAAGAAIYAATDFCTFYESVCAGAPTHTATCSATYTASMSLATDQRHCRSYHLCNAFGAAGTPATVNLHCGHAVGVGLCN